MRSRGRAASTTRGATAAGSGSRPQAAAGPHGCGAPVQPRCCRRRPIRPAVRHSRPNTWPHRTRARSGRPRGRRGRGRRPVPRVPAAWPVLPSSSTTRPNASYSTSRYSCPSGDRRGTCRLDGGRPWGRSTRVRYPCSSTEQVPCSMSSSSRRIHGVGASPALGQGGAQPLRGGAPTAHASVSSRMTSASVASRCASSSTVCSSGPGAGRGSTAPVRRGGHPVHLHALMPRAVGRRRWRPGRRRRRRRPAARLQAERGRPA